jgi:apolipoprotein N-acyltransferase
MNRKLQYSIIVFSTLVLILTGFQLYSLPLWSWWTLPFIGTFWTLIVGLRFNKYNPKWLMLSTFSGIFLIFGFPVSPLTPLMFIGFVPLLIIEKELRESASKEGILKYAYNAFVIWNIGSTFWVANSALVPGMIANFLNALFMALPFWLFHKSLKFRFFNTYLKYTSFVIFWLSFEYIHLNWEISWPWLTLGNAFAQYPSWVQWYEYTGVFGGSLWILLMNIVVFKALENKFYLNSSIKIPSIQLILGLVIPLSISVFLSTPTINFTDKASVLIVQPNYEPHYEKFNTPDEVQLKKILNLASQKIDSTTDYLVLPETSFDFHNIQNWQSNPTVLELKKFINQYPKLHLVTGVDALKIYASYTTQKPDNLASSVREFDNKDGSFTYFEVYNAATQITSGSDSLPLYKKSKLVPGPEILPYGVLFVWLKPLFKKFGGTVGGLGGQPERSVFWNKNGKTAVAPVICYESIYGDYCGGYVRAGANALFVVTNDGWWDNTPGYQQHAAFARLRAIEFRRTVIRSANTGTSCFIDAYGNVEQATPYAVDAVIKKDIQLNNQFTFYAQMGDIIGKVAVWSSLILILIIVYFKIALKK